MTTAVRELEALRIGPDERLLLRLPDDWSDADLEGLMKNLGEIGLHGRCIIISGDVEMAVVKK